MSVDNAILLTLITLMSSNIGNTFAECVSNTPCSCIMPNGEGYDLSKIISSKEKFIKSTTVSNRTFFFHPCRDEPFIPPDNTLNTTGCNSKFGISLCFYNATVNQATNLGNVNNSTMSLQSANEPQIIFKHVLLNGSYITVSIDLVCSLFKNKPTVLTEYDDASGALNYNLALVSSHACKRLMRSGGLSTGSVLVIIFLIFSGIYFAGGALTLKLLRGATGWEMLPNQKFWFDFPALVRDGVAFTFNGCKVVSYDQI